MGSFKKLLILGNSMHHLTLNAYINVECLRPYRMMVLVKINTYCMNRFVFLLSSPEVLQIISQCAIRNKFSFFFTGFVVLKIHATCRRSVTPHYNNRNPCLCVCVVSSNHNKGVFTLISNNKMTKSSISTNFEGNELLHNQLTNFLHKF